MQKQTHTTFLLIIKKRNEHDLYVVCATSKIFLRFEKKLMLTKGTFRSLWGVLYHAGLFFFYLKIGDPVFVTIFRVLK